MKRAFILSDCEPPVCDEKPYALLTANVTKGHHFISQTEQRQHAFNRQVNPQNQNVYRLPLALFGKPGRGEAASVNIENNLKADNLYTLSFVEGNGGRQYNLENWFSRHESGHEEACGALRALNGGTQPLPDPLRRILQLKLLGILRNPYNHDTPLSRALHQAIFSQLPAVSAEFTGLIEQRPQPRLSAILKKFSFTPQAYTRWLANLYGMLSDGVMQPSLFERLFAALFADEQAVRTELFRYGADSGACLFADTGFCLQPAKTEISVGLNIAEDLFALVHLKRSRWDSLKHNFAQNTAAQPKAAVTVFDNRQHQRIVFNRLCIRQAREAVYGRSGRPQDYL